MSEKGQRGGERKHDPASDGCNGARGCPRHRAAGGLPPGLAQEGQPPAAATVEQKLQHLLDREAIGQAIVAYGFSFDRRDWALHRSLFADEIEMDFSASIGSGLTRMKADDWVAGVRPSFENLPATQHRSEEHTSEL